MHVYGMNNNMDKIYNNILKYMFFHRLYIHMDIYSMCRFIYKHLSYLV